MTYYIRSAGLKDLPLLQHIEAEAAKLFKDTPYSFIADEPVLSIGVLEAHFHEGRLWVAVDERDSPVGFALVSIVDNTAYLQEIDVHPNRARQGIGCQLVEYVFNWAKENNYQNIYLSTFADLPWNAPFYVKLGFEVVGKFQLTAGFQQIRQKEADAGFPIEKRVIMRRQL